METTYKNKVQKWAGYYLGSGEYAVKYVPKQAEIVTYKFTSDIPNFQIQEGILVVDNFWPGQRHSSDYKLGANWYTDKADPQLYDGKIQGGQTILKWRKQVLLDWAKRWEWLR
jgi:hypothetical protein